MVLCEGVMCVAREGGVSMRVGLVDVDGAGRSVGDL